ncbi:MAG: ATP-binding protein [Gammaproteobacteria bacterium]|nr:ATP-binding protein [Gammaproteobacteria bacterium]
MNSTSDHQNFRFAISLSILNHLGRKLYRNFTTVLGEAISNAWDADATSVWITIDRETSSFLIVDDGSGMDSDDFQNKLLTIGYSKRSAGTYTTLRGRPYIGCKGIGKLALLSCADRVTIISKKRNRDYIGGVIDNSDLDTAITQNLHPEQYLLEQPNFDFLSTLPVEHEQGTILWFENTKERIRNSVPYLRKLLAMSFRFSLLDEGFTIYVNNERVTTGDLESLTKATEFVWLLNDYEDELLEACQPLEIEHIELPSNLNVKGFLATVAKPRDLKIAGVDERATVDLFVNGRLREKHILRHIPTQRILDNYIYGQIHYDDMDVGGSDPFTSSREGIVEDNPEFRLLLQFLKQTALIKIRDEWDLFRLKRGKPGDDENPRKTKRARVAQELYVAASQEYALDNSAPERDQVQNWVEELREDAEFNISAYVDCFLSENLVRQYIQKHNIPLTSRAPRDIKEWKRKESRRKSEANISFDISQSTADLSYLDMDSLALTAEEAEDPTNVKTKPQSLWADAVVYKPLRNAVAHTSLLTNTAKQCLSVTFENIKARVKTIIGKKPP